MSEFWGEENPKRHLFFSRFFIQVPAQSHGKQETVKLLWIFFFLVYVYKKVTLYCL